ncbi:MAG: two-component system sensor histidine kinase NtrB [Syntrophomonadaceae bacterium]|jgi:PAS domain S-box-containing protein
MAANNGRLKIADVDQVILESIATGVIITDNDARVVLINKAAEDILDLSKQEALGNSYFEVLAEQSRELLIKTFNYVVKSGRPFIGNDVEITTRKGANIIVKPFISPIRDREGVIWGMVLIFDDVTEKRQMEEHVLRSEKLAALGQLAIGVAHEIRNPLGSIKGFALIIQRDLPPDHPLQKFIDIIIKESERLGKVTQELLDFARPSKTQLSYLNVNWFIEKVLFLIEMENTNKKITYIRNFNETIKDIYASEEQLQQVIINLLQNSIQAIGNNAGTINIATRQVPSWVEISISDSGEGIPPQILSKIFNPFFTTREKGTGMGLAIVHQIMDRHGGHIQVSSHPQKGSTFVLRFPIEGI